MTKDEALKMDLENLIDRFNEGWHEGIEIDASDIMLLSNIREALDTEQVREAQEPVAWIYQNNSGYPSLMWNPLCVYEYESITLKQPKIPLYTHPHKWQGLTDDEKTKAFSANHCDYLEDAFMCGVQFAEVMLKEKNYG